MKNTFLAALVLVTSACATSNTASPGGSASASTSGGPTDAEIAAIVVTANQIDIDTGRLAAGKTSSPRVREFAQRMIQDHESVNQAAGALVARLGITPQENATSRSLEKGAAEARARLQDLAGSDFDRAYVAHEVTYHQAVIDAVDSALIPNARNAELREMLVNVRPALVAHLEHARSLQKELAGGGPVSHGGH